jgi:hypothetical protein
VFSPQVWLIGALSFLLAVGGAYIKGRTDGGAIARADQAEVLELARQVRDDAQRGAAEAIAKIEIKQTTIRQTLEKEIHEKPVYRDCRHDADSLPRINAALTGREPQPAGGGKLPRLDATQ